MTQPDKRRVAPRLSPYLRPILCAALLLPALSGCNILTRLSEVGGGPKISQIENPTAAKDYKPVSLPMPAPQMVESNPNSLWRAGARAFFKDHRAKEVGDIITVELDLDDKATLTNDTTRVRADTESTAVSRLLGFENSFSKHLPEAVDPTNLINFDNDHSTSGEGDIKRTEVISLTFAAVVTQILPNGALAIMGRQEVKVSNELRELEVTGVIRPSDIDSDNTISHKKIAEMRVSYGGRGNLSDLQAPRWGTQLWDILFPF